MLTAIQKREAVASVKRAGDVSVGYVDLGNLAPDVLEAISSERRYQTMKYHENELTVGEWILLISAIVADAKAKWRRHGNEDPLEEVRQVAAAAFACLEQHGAPKRQLPDDSPSVLDLAGAPEPHPAGAEFSTSPRPMSEPEIDFPLTLPEPNQHGEYHFANGCQIYWAEGEKFAIYCRARLPDGKRLEHEDGSARHFNTPEDALAALNAALREASTPKPCGFDVTAVSG